MNKKEKEIKAYITIGILLVFGVLFLFFPWKIVLGIMLVFMALNAFYTAIKKMLVKDKNMI